MKRLLAVAIAVALGFSGALGTMPAAAQAAGEIELPDYVGEPADIAQKSLDALDLKSKLDGQGRWVLSKKNWVVVSQKPKAGSLVEPGDKVTLVLIKKSEVISDARAVVLCRQHADDVDAFPFEVDWPIYDFVSAEKDLGVTVRSFGTTKTAGGAEYEVSIRCEYTGTNKKPKLVKFEVLE